MATIKDVAKEAGVAVETVSRVLNNRGYISQKTRDKVEQAMQKIGYMPNAIAQGLSKKNMGCIAVIVSHIEHPYFAKMISKIEKEATERNYKVLLYNSYGKEQNEKYALQFCQSSFISGVLLFSPDISEKTLKDLNIPIVLVEKNAIGNAVSIQCDNKGGGRTAAEHLLEKKCIHPLVFATSYNEEMSGNIREVEFMKTCEKAGIHADLYSATVINYESMDYYEIIEKALDEHPECDGIFATSDLICAQIIQVCAKRGICIPQDIKLIGFDDVELAKLTSPTLTTIRQPIREMVKAALDAIEKIHAGETVEKNQILPVNLIERESTCS